ncbi:RNA-guided endonuclease InsQ/TnpB family protein [Arthrospira platensis]|jgi:putative transposase|uniref:Transposase n=1 Tax=Limnospira platensis NIES-46 TaxID=1236695 RepID=A0A5M3T2Y7_LIMPL|nr:RNA-guided endonuclease TnpB family protein [Arthrospira platensis]AMW28019.1 transposase [Arthrospira platensis YZ]KDR54556.1 transposase [Arthrospira platensis str. Paraca]MBD2668817.1 transposase [Arthrospira platensis FACHB-439]MBD2711991.1 transposase [Arthrospira platensis FACHB-835]MDF2210178.1 RNA-guided endonuclease TnpB family protein [Arthrospira platensis NCB002]MDT9298161.1 RNA-guided endonuclease TnpB family protein [Arthrospira platensis PCC 7345]MDT9313086.1 RNA-guided end
MKARYQYRIYPTVGQQQSLAQLFGCVRVAFNDGLAFSKQSGQYPGVKVLSGRLTEAKKTMERAWLGDVSSVPLQQALQDLDIAYRNFFKSVKGERKGPRVNPPRFKKKTNRQSARFTKAAFKLKGSKVYVAKIGELKTKWSRPLPSEPSSVTVIKDCAGRYFVSFVVEIQPITVEPKNQGVGVDLGLETLATLSTGEKVKASNTNTLDRKIRKGKRKLARSVKGSRGRGRLRVAIARTEAKQSDIRQDFNQKLATRLVGDNSVVVLEDLNVSGMVKNRCLARAISRAGWRQIRTLCEAKANMINEREVRVISRWEPTSGTCSCCGDRWGKLDLSIRSVLCLNCGAEQDRDINASVNILAAGLADLNGQTLSYVRPQPGAVACLSTRQEAI